MVMLAACSNGRGSLDVQSPAQGVAQSGLTIGGSISGLMGGSVVLQNNGVGNLSLSSDGAFVFADPVSTGATYNVTVLTQPAAPPQTCTVANGAGTVASTNVTNITITCTTAPRFTIGGTVSGLTGSGLVLQSNGADDLAINTNGSFAFSTALATSTAYNVTVRTQPNGQSCVVRNPSGAIAAANVANVEVACVANQFTIGGTVDGLSGRGLVLRLNGGSDLSIVNNGPFAFSVSVAEGSAYAVTVQTAPSGPAQACTIANGAGTISGANVANITVSCTTSSFSIGGQVGGLAGSGLVLQLNGANDVPIPSNGAFTFATPISSGASYVVTVLSQPTVPSQVCTVAHGHGTVGSGNVGNVEVACATRTFAVGGTVLGLLGTGLVLRNNGGDDVVAANGRFRFPTALASGATYGVTVQSQPTSPTQACTLTNSGGTVGDAEVTDIVVDCSTSNFTIGGTVTNLVGTGLVLSNNGADNLTVGASGAFSFPTAIPSGASFSVTIAQQPTNPSQTCAVLGGAGAVGSANVTTIDVQCTTDGYTVGGNVSGMLGSGLVLQNNGLDNLPIASTGPFRFPTPLLPATPYNVTVAVQPANPVQFCFVASNVGVIGNANVQDVQVTCVGGQ